MHKLESLGVLSMPCYEMPLLDNLLQGEHTYEAAWLKAHIAGHVCWTRHRFPLDQGSPVPSGYADPHMRAQDLSQAAAPPLMCCGSQAPAGAMPVSLCRAWAALQAAEHSARRALLTRLGVPKTLA